ncbi:UrcA family protein [Sphingomonas sp. AP4-R1]|uniref:UrcA family protein n=1 Tax=Sphingomonas sp. AP4-R1 TaxID=2735134 RepID=UPI0014934268|nr:UrcA family protein [Sphingomonas sp. AP4-R1]QJU58039.1 UrcA family protein [Sphingomonas sp. AP4-R1]
MTHRTLIATSLLTLLAAPAATQTPVTGADRVAIRLDHIDRHPATPAAARRTLSRIDRAVTEACGASGFSLREVKQATRDSACWRETMADAVSQVDSPLLHQVYAERAAGDAKHAL